MSAAPTPPPPVLTDAELRAGCERDLARLEAIAQAATDLALEIQRRTMAAMREEEVMQAVPSRAVIAFNRVARVQRQTILLSCRLRRELRAWDTPPAREDGAPRPPRDTEDRIEAAHRRLADTDTHPDHQVERLAAEAEDRLEAEAFDPDLIRSIDTQIMALNDRLDFARRLAGLEPDEGSPHRLHSSPIGGGEPCEPFANRVEGEGPAPRRFRQSPSTSLPSGGPRSGATRGGEELGSSP